MDQEKPGLTLERKIETLVDQLGMFDQRLRKLEEGYAKFASWCDKVYELLAPMYEDYKKRTGGK